MSFSYPKIRRDETIRENYHGVEIRDPYRWLENPSSHETKIFVDFQNKITRNYVESPPYRYALKKNLMDSWTIPHFHPPFRQGDKYFQFRNSGRQYHNVLYILDIAKNKTTLLFDPNRLSPEGNKTLEGVKFSHDGKTLAYGFSLAGTERCEIRFRDVETCKDFAEILRNVKFTSMSWMLDNAGFFYCSYVQCKRKRDGSKPEANRTQRICYHKLGTTQSKDIPVLTFDDPYIKVTAHVSYCGNYLVVTMSRGEKNNGVYFANLDSDGRISGKLKLYPIVTDYDADYEYITNNGSKFLFRTNRNAPNYKLIIVDVNHQKAHEKITLVREHSKNILEEVKPVNSNLMVLLYLKDVKHILRLHYLETGSRLMEFPLEIGTVSEMTGGRNDKEIFFGFTSFLKPNVIYRLDFSTSDVKPEIYHETKVPRFDANLFECKQVFYESKDGTKIPMFILHKKDFVQDGSSPCLLYAYGGFGLTLTSQFSISPLVFVGHFNGIFASANIRGGGEYGERWHEAGILENKQNSFDDFQYAAKYLVERNYTNPKKLIIQGGSNGGLLVAACITQAPELFGAAISHVGVLDMLRYHKFTIGYTWKSEYGHSDKKEDFKYLIRYSPLHNVKIPVNENVQYPATLLLTADEDNRVVPMHSYKFISELQYVMGLMPQQTNPLMIRVELRGGHGANMPTNNVIDEVVDIYCFLGKALGLVYKRK